jgi:hypothetical protein
MNSIAQIPSLRTMSSKTFKVLQRICTTPMRRTGVQNGADEWTAKIIDILAAAGYIKREPDGSYAATNKGRDLVGNRMAHPQAFDRIAKACMPVRNSTAPGDPSNRYTGAELTAPAVRPGADDHFQCPSLRPDGRYYRDGRVEAL